MPPLQEVGGQEQTKRNPAHRVEGR